MRGSSLASLLATSTRFRRRLRGNTITQMELMERTDGRMDANGRKSRATGRDGPPRHSALREASHRSSFCLFACFLHCFSFSSSLSLAISFVHFHTAGVLCRRHGGGGTVPQTDCIPRLALILGLLRKEVGIRSSR